MKILFVILAVILLLIVLLLFVLLSPLSITIRYEDGVTVKAGLSFIRIKVFPKKERKNKKDKKANKKKKEKSDNAPKSSHVFEKGGNKDTDTSGTQKSDETKGSVRDTIILVYDIVKSVFEMLGKRAKIRIDVLKAVVSKEDAADTAIQFGVCGGIVTSLLAFTSNFGKAVIKDENVSVEPDFVSGKSRIELDITLSARVIFILSSLIRGYFRNQSRI